jgi:LAS superfamily LD-carboxypeptidase LdcB
VQLAGLSRILDRVRVLVVLCVLLHVARAESVVGYRNGKPIKLEVTDVDGVWVEVTTARAFVVMRDAADAAGVYLQAWSGFRSNQKQTELHEAWKAGVGNPAAKPGYSNHQTGRAIDINLLGVPKETYAWLTKHASRYRFRRTVPSEPWHWEYSPPRRAASRHARR